MSLVLREQVACPLDLREQLVPARLFGLLPARRQAIEQHLDLVAVDGDPRDAGRAPTDGASHTHGAIGCPPHRLVDSPLLVRAAIVAAAAGLAERARARRVADDAGEIRHAP